jgi:8-oxo-dGTP diphosphatase
MADFYKIGLITLRDGRVLLCRKRTLTSKLILPGGRVEPGEDALDCLRRELHEELGDVAAPEVDYLGTYEDRAASDDPTEHKTVEIVLYRGALVGDPAPHSEIKELVWFGKDDDWEALSPILVRKIFPDLIDRGVLPWR